MLQTGMKVARRDGEGLKPDSCKALPSTKTSGFQGQRGGTGMGLPYNGFYVLLMDLNNCRALWVSGTGPIWGHSHESNRALKSKTVVTFRHKAMRDPIGLWAKDKAQRKSGNVQGRGSKRKENSPTLKLSPSSTYTQTDTNTHRARCKTAQPTPPHDLPQWLIWPGPRIPPGASP